MLKTITRMLSFVRVYRRIRSQCLSVFPCASNAKSTSITTRFAWNISHVHRTFVTATRICKIFFSYPFANLVKSFTHLNLRAGDPSPLGRGGKPASYYGYNLSPKGECCFISTCTLGVWIQLCCFVQ